MPTIPIFKVFGRSPIRPLQLHMKSVSKCVQELLPFFHAVMKGEWSEVEIYRQKIVKLEHEADNLKRELRLNLPKGLFMPVQRSDILELVTRQDMLANKAKDITGIVIGRKMVIPPQAAKLYEEFLESAINAAKHAYEAINELDELFEAGFSGKEMQVIEGMVNRLHKIERESDGIEIKVRQAVFEIEADLPPVNVVFLYKVIEWTGDIAGYAQRVGDGLQILIAR